MDPSMMNISSDSYFGGLTKAAKELAAIEKRGGRIPDKFDFGVQAACASCKQNILQKPMRCAACKAVVYCSKKCAIQDWKQPVLPGVPTHKMLCADNKRHMEKLPQTQAILKSFPWGRIESDGSFNVDIARGRYGVLGGSGYGYWSHRGGPVPHSDQGRLTQMLGNTPYADQMLKMIKSFDHLDGKDLLKQKHLTDVEGWKLPPNLIPYRNFAAPNAKRPVLVTEFDELIMDWDKWYCWRGLPKESPAALLMHFPMSTYQLLVHCLDVTNPKLGRPEKRISLEVHIIGLEVELNFLPIFAELALLLPYHDIKLVGFGSGVEKLIEEAKRNRPTSLAANTDRNTPVFTYEAPDECGGSTIAIHLHGSSKVWPRPLSSDTPDAIIACNAGLGSYPEWIPVVQAAHELDIPFGVTEYTEQSLETQLSSFPKMLWGTSATPKRVEEYKIDLNPFQMPGQRGIPMYKLPNVVNGFTMVVNKKAKSPAELAARLDRLDLD